MGQGGYGAGAVQSGVGYGVGTGQVGRGGRYGAGRREGGYGTTSWEGFAMHCGIGTPRRPAPPLWTDKVKT